MHISKLGIFFKTIFCIITIALLVTSLYAYKLRNPMFSFYQLVCSHITETNNDPILKTPYVAFERASIQHLIWANNTLNYKVSHALATYNWYDNFVLYLLNAIFGNDLNAVVLPLHLYEFSYGICSQKVIRLFDYLKQCSFTCRVVRLNRHFCGEVFVNGNWIFVDPGYKLQLPLKPPFYNAVDIQSSNVVFKDYYLSNLDTHPTDTTFIHHFFDTVTPDKANLFPAKNLALLHIVCLFLSDYLALLCLPICGYLFIKRRTFTQSNQLKLNYESESA